MEGRDEFSVIDRLISRLTATHPDVVTGIGDDAAVLAVPEGVDLLISTDTLVQGVHFSAETMDDTAVGYKAVTVSVSDMAAMGGRPQSVVLAITMPQDANLAALEAMYDGVNEACQRYHCAMAGGNLSRTEGPMVITSTVTGWVPRGRAVLRSGAKPGDVVFVTGHLGASHAGLQAMLQGGVLPGDEAVQLIHRHQRPVAQVEAGQILREAGASSLNDISDGLASELNEISVASGVRLRIDASRVPIQAAVRNFANRRREDPLDYAWYGGEDYELVGTAPSFSFARALTLCEGMGVRLTRIGRVEPGDGVVADVKGQLQVLEPKGFNHFRA